MLCVAFIVCLVLLPRRIRQGIPSAVPVGVVVLGAVRGVLIAVTVAMLMATFKELGKVSPEAKHAVLQAGIDQAMPYARFGMVFEFPLLLAAWFADGALRKRHRPRLPPAQAAPDGASCATHAADVATLICVRCGGFMCAVCGKADGSLCSACGARQPTPDHMWGGRPIFARTTRD
jgi:hypothetical protein